MSQGTEGFLETLRQGTDELEEIYRSEEELTGEEEKFFRDKIAELDQFDERIEVEGETGEERYWEDSLRLTEEIEALVDEQVEALQVISERIERFEGEEEELAEAGHKNRHTAIGVMEGILQIGLQVMRKVRKNSGHSEQVEEAGKRMDEVRDKMEEVKKFRGGPAS